MLFYELSKSLSRVLQVMLMVLMISDLTGFGSTAELTGLQQDIQTAESFNNARVLNRKRRYLVFPEGSTFSMAWCGQITMTTAAREIFSEGWNWALSYDLPNETLADAKPKILHPVFLRRHKRDFYKQIEVAMESAGIDGRICVLNALCEASQQLVPKEGLLQELLRTLFTYSSEHELYDLDPHLHGEYSDAQNRGELNENCRELFPCPVSLLSIGLGFGDALEPPLFD